MCKRVDHRKGRLDPHHYADIPIVAALCAAEFGCQFQAQVVRVKSRPWFFLCSMRFELRGQGSLFQSPKVGQWGIFPTFTAQDLKSFLFSKRQSDKHTPPPHSHFIFSPDRAWFLPQLAVLVGWTEQCRSQGRP